MDRWLGLMIGNSRLHWAYVQEETSGTAIQRIWDTSHMSEENKIDSEPRQVSELYCMSSLKALLPLELKDLLADQPPIPLKIASVVPSQTPYWRTYPDSQIITLKDIPLTNLYSTLGIDRALAILGAWKDAQTSALVIDGGTALTLTGVNANGQLIGGAILPGLGLQMRSLHDQTAALPKTLFENEPHRWQRNTPDAIRSGVWYGLLAGVQGFINDWLRQYPNSTITFTGGDGKRLWQRTKEAIASQWPGTNVIYDPQIIFKGMIPNIIKYHS